MEAVQDQFEVFDSLVVPSQTITVQGNYSLTVAVLDVIRKHLRPSNDQLPLRTTSETIQTVENTFLKVCKLLEENVIEFSFVVIVTNQNGYSGGLCKIPICIVTVQNRAVFIDINGKIFNSWDTLCERTTFQLASSASLSMAVTMSVGS